jgi:hypothetical protein
MVMMCETISFFQTLLGFSVSFLGRTYPQFSVDTGFGTEDSTGAEIGMGIGGQAFVNDNIDFGPSGQIPESDRVDVGSGPWHVIQVGRLSKELFNGAIKFGQGTNGRQQPATANLMKLIKITQASKQSEETDNPRHVTAAMALPQQRW